MYVCMYLTNKFTSCPPNFFSSKSLKFESHFLPKFTPYLLSPPKCLHPPPTNLEKPDTLSLYNIFHCPSQVYFLKTIRSEPKISLQIQQTFLKFSFSTFSMPVSSLSLSFDLCFFFQSSISLSKVSKTPISLSKGLSNHSPITSLSLSLSISNSKSSLSS